MRLREFNSTVIDAAATVILLIATVTVTAVLAAATTTAAWTLIASYASPAVATRVLSGIGGLLFMASVIAAMVRYAQWKAAVDNKATTGHASGTDP
jgi:hypothetical protein